MYRLRVEFPAVGTVYTLTAEAGAYAMTGQAATLTYIGGLPPAPAAEGVSRVNQDLLFQPLDVKQRVTVWGTYDFETASPTGGPGPTWDRVDRRSGWEWTNAGGDWIDAAGVKQGTTHWVSIATNSGSGTTYNQDVTAMVRWIKDTGRWNAWRMAPSGSTARTLATHRNADPDKRPQLTVTYTDASVVVYDATMVSKPSSGSTTPSTFLETGNLPFFVEFPKPTKEVASASLRFHVVTQWSGTQPITINPCDPPITQPEQGPGLATPLYLDAGLEALPGVIGVHRYEDGPPDSTWISPLPDFNLYDTDFSPDVYGAGAPDTGKLPYLDYGKWINANYDGGNPNNLNRVSSSYTGQAFEPIAPGIGAVMTKLAKYPGLADGFVTGQDGSPGCDALIYMPADKMAAMRHIRLRYAVRFHRERELGYADRVLGTAGGSAFIQHSGKWGPSPYGEASGGRSGGSGGGRGWQMRNQWLDCVDGTEGPDQGGIVVGCHYKDDFKTPVNYTNIGLNELWGDGGYGSVMYPDRWYWVEHDFKLNTVTTSGIGYLPDGEHTVWVNGRRVFHKTGLVHRSLPINNNVTAPSISLGGANVGNGTITDLATYNGAPTFHNTNPEAIPEAITLTFTSATTFDVVGSFYGTDAPGTVGVDYTSGRTHKFRVNAGGTPWQAGDTITLTYPLLYTTPSAIERTGWKELGVQAINLNLFHGGKTEALIDRWLFITAMAWGDGDEMASHFGPMQTNPVQAAGTVQFVGYVAGGHPAGEPAVIERLSPKYQAWAVNPGVNDRPWSGSGVLEEKTFASTAFAYCGAGWDHVQERFLGHGAGHVACNVPVPWEYRLSDYAGAWLDTPPTTDAFSRLNGSPATPANLVAQYTPVELDSAVGEWQGDAWGRPGRIYLEGGHSYQMTIFVPGGAAGAGNTHGIILPVYEPSGRSISPSNRNQHYFDLDTKRWVRTVNKATHTGANCGAAWWVESANRVIAVTGSASVYRTTADIFNPLTKTWSTAAILANVPGVGTVGLPIAAEHGGIRDYPPASLVLNFCPVTDASNAPNYAGTKHMIHAADITAVLAGSATFQPLTVTAASWPLLGAGGVTGSGTIGTIGWCYCPLNGCFYAINGLNGSTTLWKLAPPAGATVQADYLSGTWSITTETLASGISNPGAGGTGNASSIYDRLRWSAKARGGLGALVYMSEYTLNRVQQIVPAGL